MSSQHILMLVFIISVFAVISLVESANDQLYVRLRNAARENVFMPAIGLGTAGYGQPNSTGPEYWGPEEGHNATVAWLKLGGRRIDSADNYNSRDGIGTGWVASGVPRSEIFLTSKVDPTGYNETLEQFDGILKSLRTDYVDLVLIHWPGARPTTFDETNPPCMQGKSTWADCRLQTWLALEKIFERQQVGMC